MMYEEWIKLLERSDISLKRHWDVMRGSNMDSGATSMRGMANPPGVSDSGGVSIPDSDVISEDWDMDKVVNGGKVYTYGNDGMDDSEYSGVNDVKRGKVCIHDNDGMDDEDDMEYIKRGKVCIRVRKFGDWLRANEPTTIDEYAHHIRTTASTIPLEQWADIHHPELREMWAIVRYRGDI